MYNFRIHQSREISKSQPKQNETLQQNLSFKKIRLQYLKLAKPFKQKHIYLLEIFYRKRSILQRTNIARKHTFIRSKIADYKLFSQIRMGVQQSKPQSVKKQRQNSSGNYYGGALSHNPLTNTTYQQFIIEEKHYDQFVTLIRTRQKLYHEHFITIKDFWKKTKPNDTFSCTTDKRIEIFVEYQSQSENFSKRLDRLSQASKLIPQIQLVNIFTSVVSCLIYLKSKGTCHGDIKPQSIYFDNLGQVKLLDSFFMNGGRTSYEIVMENPSSMSLLSPEQLSRLNDKQFDDISLVYKNEAFSLGLTMYESMTFQPAMQCYDLQKLKIKKDFFKGKEQIMYNNGYSKKLIDIVVNLILKPADTRLDFAQIYEILTHFSY